MTEDNIINLDSFTKTIEDAMTLMKSTDFHPESGMNESGFKAMFLLLLEKQFGANPDIRILSEQFVQVNGKNYFIDVLLENTRQKRAFIFELKYIR